MLNKPKTKTVLFSLLWVIFTPPLPSVASETPARIVTESGLTLLVQESHSLPMVTIQVIIGGGVGQGSGGKSGIGPYHRGSFG